MVALAVTVSDAAGQSTGSQPTTDPITAVIGGPIAFTTANIGYLQSYIINNIRTPWPRERWLSRLGTAQTDELVFRALESSAPHRFGGCATHDRIVTYSRTTRIPDWRMCRSRLCCCYIRDLGSPVSPNGLPLPPRRGSMLEGCEGCSRLLWVLPGQRRPAGLSRKRFKNAVKASAEARVIAAASAVKAATQPGRRSHISARANLRPLPPIGRFCNGSSPQPRTPTHFRQGDFKKPGKARKPRLPPPSSLLQEFRGCRKPATARLTGQVRGSRMSKRRSLIERPRLVPYVKA